MTEERPIVLRFWDIKKGKKLLKKNKNRFPTKELEST
jgi:hypothetical protein